MSPNAISAFLFFLVALFSFGQMYMTWSHDWLRFTTFLSLLNDANAFRFSFFLSRLGRRGFPLFCQQVSVFHVSYNTKNKYYKKGVLLLFFLKRFLWKKICLLHPPSAQWSYFLHVIDVFNPRELWRLKNTCFVNNIFWSGSHRSLYVFIMDFPDLFRKIKWKRELDNKGIS